MSAPNTHEDGYTFCPTCDTDRDIDALESGCCPFCDTYIEDLPPVEPASAATTPPVKQKGSKPGPVAGAKATQTTTKPDVRLVAEEEAFRMAYDAPQATIDPVIERELAQRTLCRRRLMPFIKRFRPKYDAGWVHDDICRRLERFVKAVERGESPRLLLMMPPRGGKSEIGSRNFPAWVLGQHPEWEIIAGSHTSSLTMSFSRYVRDLMRDPAYTAVFPNTTLDPSSQSVENWNLLQGGGYLAAGVGTGITGRGAHILLLDDLVKDWEAAQSSTIRDNTWQWYNSTAYTRLAPGGGVLGIMTWWNESDWAGRVQEVMAAGDGDIFEIIKYPAINEEGDEYLLPDDSIIQIHPDSPDPVPPGARLTRPHNTALHPARYTTDMMLRIKRSLVASGEKRVWDALYQQDPLPDEGILFKKEHFRYYATLPALHTCHAFQAWDFAITESKQSDWTVGITLLQDERDNLYVADMRRFRSSDSFVITDEILNFAKEWEQDDGTLPTLGFEDGQIWKAMSSVFERRCTERKMYPSFELLQPLTDKLVRASPLRGRMQLGKVWFHLEMPDFKAMYLELTRFPNAKHDDIVDSLAWTTRLSFTRHVPRAPEPPPQKSWRDKLRYLAGETDGGHMSA